MEQLLKGPRLLNWYESEQIGDEWIYHSDEFRMYVFKIKKCPKTRSHDWTSCPFAHRGEKARRRDPRKINYAAIACPEFRTGECSKGELCEFAHGIFEFWLHPSKYRTRACNAGGFCQRKVCFFAHAPEELRPMKKPKLRFISKPNMGEAKKEISNGSVTSVGGGFGGGGGGGGGGGLKIGMNPPPAEKLTRDEISMIERDITENLRKFILEDDEEVKDDGQHGSFGFGDLPDLPDIDWVTDLLN